MRSLQGLLFLINALFVVKWQYHEIETFRYQYMIETLPPFKHNILLFLTAVIAIIGVYVLISGEIANFRKRERYSMNTFLSCVSAFTMIFTIKWAYCSSPNLGKYYPPFDKESLGAVFTFFAGLTIYFFLRGEIDFWKFKEGHRN